jgi:hypothetical protein
MKNLTATIAFLLSTFSLLAQYDRKGILISSSLGFAKSEAFSLSNPSNINIPPSQNISKSSSIAPEISYVASEKFMIGLGYFSNSNESNFNSSITTFSNGTTVIGGSFSNLNSSKISGLTLHMRYSQNVFSKLIFSLKFTYLNLKGENISEISSVQNNSNFPNQFDKRMSTFSFGEARFSPSIHYFISKNFGCYVETLGLNLRFSDSRKVNKEIDYNFDLNPNTWRIGFFYFIPTQKASE